MFTTILTRFRHLTLPSISWIQSHSLQSVSLRFPSDVPLNLQVVASASGFLIKILYAFLVCPLRATRLAHLILDLIIFHYAVFFRLLLTSSLLDRNILLSTLFSNMTFCNVEVSCFVTPWGFVIGSCYLHLHPEAKSCNSFRNADILPHQDTRRSQKTSMLNVRHHQNSDLAPTNWFLVKKSLI